MFYSSDFFWWGEGGGVELDGELLRLSIFLCLEVAIDFAQDSCA
jgi:hypothetical protein